MSYHRLFPEPLYINIEFRYQVLAAVDTFRGMTKNVVKGFVKKIFYVLLQSRDSVVQLEHGLRTLYTDEPIWDDISFFQRTLEYDILYVTTGRM